ncbi:hypothetical protein ACO2JO_14510 [Leptospira interrogans]
MAPIGGWNIWGKTGERIRQFTVAKISEQEAVAVVSAQNPDVEVLSRHAVEMNTIARLGMPPGDITEWVPLDCKEKLLDDRAALAGFRPRSDPVADPIR